MPQQPDLTACSDQAQQAFASLLKMTKGTSIRATTVMNGLGTRLGIDQIEVKGLVRELYRAQLLCYTPDRQELPASGLIEIVRPEKTVSLAEQQWMLTLGQSTLSAGAKRALEPFYAKVSDLSNADMASLVDCLAELASQGIVGMHGAGFNVSARAIMGGSKVLASVDFKAMQALGLPVRLKTSSPRYVVCAGPSAPVVTLLIENPRAFENAVRSGLGETVSLVCTYGFGLSYLGQAWVEDMHSEDKPIQIIRSGTPGSLSALLQAKQVFLWADLDLAALSIYRSLKSTISQLQFSAIYQVMMEMVKDGKRSHPYAAIFEKDGQVVSSTSMIDDSDPVAKAIFESCRTRAVDQEAVLETDILLLGKGPLKIDTEA
jgi:hypothetical protein